MDFCSRVFLVFTAISRRRSHDDDVRRMEIGPAGARLATKHSLMQSGRVGISMRTWPQRQESFNIPIVESAEPLAWWRPFDFHIHLASSSSAPRTKCQIFTTRMHNSPPTAI